jgi:3-deoxy-7-phosphoheptulonate synthase
MSTTYQEWFMAAEYLMTNGNGQIILCERGIRMFEPSLRNTLDLAGIIYLRRLTHLPIILDPSHATGRRELIGSVSNAAIAAGADGLIIEVHHDPEFVLCDGPQAVTLEQFAKLASDLKPYLQLEHKSIYSSEKM